MRFILNIIFVISFVSTILSGDYIASMWVFNSLLWMNLCYSKRND